MIKKLFILNSIFVYVAASSQVLTYVGNSALVTIQSQTLVYNGGGFQTAGTAIVNNSGNMMISGTATDVLTLSNNTAAAFNVLQASTSDYGQLYVSGIPQNNITGNINKQYIPDYVNGTTGSQQIGLPFSSFTTTQLDAFAPGKLNLTNTTNNSSGRFAPNSVFWRNNSKARFDQVAANASAYSSGVPNLAFISPMTYYIIPRRDAAGTYFWGTNSTTAGLVTFSGKPASDQAAANVEFNLSGAYSGSFGANGSASNFFGEKYYSYLDDPIESGVKWSANYGLNLYHMANPFLTNLDLKFIGRSDDSGLASDGNAIANLAGIAFYTNANVNWSAQSGTTYNTVTTKVLKSGDPSGSGNNLLQVGDVSSTMIKPLGAFMVKLTNNTPATLKFNNTRRFSSTSRSIGTNYGVSAGKSGSNEAVPADKIVKQVAVVMYDLDGYELDRTYYAVSPSATTGFSSSASLQAYSGDRKIFTKEENQLGGEDYNYSGKLYINEANELGFKSKQIPLYTNNSDAYKLKFEVYELGERTSDGLSNGNSFYIKAGGNIIKIVDGESLSMSGSQTLGLYYEEPSATLGADSFSYSQTIIAKKDSQWVVRFAKNWKNATVEVYSAAGQLLNAKSNISTNSNYIIPVSSQVKGVFLVKVTADNGEIVVKKIIN